MRQAPQSSPCGISSSPPESWEASLKTLGDLALQYGSIEPVPEDKVAVATDLMTIDLGRGLVLEVHLTPGHASHHLAHLLQFGRKRRDFERGLRACQNLWHHRSSELH